jgi:ketol-acid reductoisomerase
MHVYYDRDADVNLIKGKNVAIIGYGSQGHSHALNLKDSGVKHLAIGLRAGSASVAKAQLAGLKTMDPADGAKWADVVMMPTPDEGQGDLYREKLRSDHEAGRGTGVCAWAERAFQPARPVPGHRRVHDRAEAPRPYGAQRIPARRRRAVPGGGGAEPVRQCAGGGAVLCLGDWRRGSGVIETTFREECETDLVGEQVVLCGGLVELIKGGYETLVDAGYAPEMAYLECLHELFDQQHRGIR